MIYILYSCVLLFISIIVVLQNKTKGAGIECNKGISINFNEERSFEIHCTGVFSATLTSPSYPFAPSDQSNRSLCNSEITLIIGNAVFLKYLLFFSLSQLCQECISRVI